MGRMYAGIVRAHPLAELVGIADLHQEVAVLAAAALGVAAYTSTDDLLNAGAIDGLIVATVENDHRGPTEAALAAGAGVLVEKPLATTIEDAEQMIAAAERAGRPLLTGHVLRFDARYAQLREIVHAGGIGEPFSLSTPAA